VARRAALIQAQGVGRAHVRGSPCRNEGGDKRAGGEDERGGGDGRRIGGSDAEQLGLDQLAEGGGARNSDGHAGGNHDDGIAQDQADGGSIRRAKREADADFAAG